MSIDTKRFEKALAIARPPTIVSLFPDSRSAIISGKFIDRAMIRKQQAAAVAINGRNRFIIDGALLAAQRTEAAIIIEIAKSEGTYCAVNYMNLAKQVDEACNRLSITIPVAVHADHYAIKSQNDVREAAKIFPQLFAAGITSLAVDASHMSDADNLLANIALNPYIPKWAGLETEVGEIKGHLGLSTPEEALFLIRGLNAHTIFPDFIALNNGTTHGIQTDTAGIDVALTKQIHDALAPYHVSGAQHGTSGNSYDRLRRIVTETATTKANIATAMQMISWGVEVDDYGNAIVDSNGRFIKKRGAGMCQDLWNEMVAYADERHITGNGYKVLNSVFDEKLHQQPESVRARMVAAVADQITFFITHVFNSAHTASLVYDEIDAADSFDPGTKAVCIEQKDDWTVEKITEKATHLTRDRGPAGDFDD